MECDRIGCTRPATRRIGFTFEKVGGSQEPAEAFTKLVTCGPCALDIKIEEHVGALQIAAIQAVLASVGAPPMDPASIKLLLEPLHPANHSLN